MIKALYFRSRHVINIFQDITDFFADISTWFIIVLTKYLLNGESSVIGRDDKSIASLNRSVVMET